MMTFPCIVIVLQQCHTWALRGGGGAIVGVRLFLEKFFHVGLSSHYGGLFLHVVGLFSPCGGNKQGALSSCGGLCSPWGGMGGGGGVVSRGGGGWNTIRTFSMKLLH